MIGSPTPSVSLSTVQAAVLAGTGQPSSEARGASGAAASNEATVRSNPRTDVAGPSVTKPSSQVSERRLDAVARTNLTAETALFLQENDPGQFSDGASEAENDLGQNNSGAVATGSTPSAESTATQQASAEDAEQAQQAGPVDGEAADDEADATGDGLSEEEEKQVKELAQRDREVRAHEQAHARTGGPHAGAPSYTFQQGPDGKRYAIGGEVAIDTSKERTPEATIRKMQVVIRAATAPAEPSSQDMKVAQQARSALQEAQTQARTERTEELRGEGDEETGVESTTSPVEAGSGGGASEGSRDGAAAGEDNADGARSVATALAAYQAISNAGRPEASQGNGLVV
ncbi:hypothetical protein J0X15_17525 [Roseibium sp. CAU 1637]|uniref:SprA family protein n=1 Tax=Roseibium limicola TaxID=2816037 RepID=A0A939JA42_9HYPH|nr:putative metalloprotease CJM1_0395 family protein [Roseibium limicola]MBO0347031.1 hypothetical protein [Roseibium limicola]